MSRGLLAALLTALALALGLATAGTASAHDVLEGSDPADGASLATSPARVTLTFSDSVQPGLSTMTVVGPGGTRWEQGRAVEQGGQVSVGVNRLGPAGRYEIGYRIVSADGHPVTGRTAFTVTAPQGGTPDTGAAAAPQGAPLAGAGDTGSAPADDGGVPAWPFIAVAVLVLGGALVIALRRKA